MWMDKACFQNTKEARTEEMNYWTAWAKEGISRKEWKRRDALAMKALREGMGMTVKAGYRLLDRKIQGLTVADWRHKPLEVKQCR